jgi:hypothetical protein
MLSIDRGREDRSDSLFCRPPLDDGAHRKDSTGQQACERHKVEGDIATESITMKDSNSYHIENQHSTLLTTRVLITANLNTHIIILQSEQWIACCLERTNKIG